MALLARMRKLGAGIRAAIAVAETNPGRSRGRDVQGLPDAQSHCRTPVRQSAESITKKEGLSWRGT